MKHEIPSFYAVRCSDVAVNSTRLAIARAASTRRNILKVRRFA